MSERDGAGGPLHRRDRVRRRARCRSLDSVRGDGDRGRRRTGWGNWARSGARCGSVPSRRRLRVRLGGFGAAGGFLGVGAGGFRGNQEPMQRLNRHDARVLVCPLLELAEPVVIHARALSDLPQGQRAFIQEPVGLGEQGAVHE